jgi:hypothetical protein
MKATGKKQEECLFSRREIREAFGWGDTQLRMHLGQLVDLEYLAVKSGQNGRKYLYELLYRGEGENGGKFLLGLSDVKELKAKLRQHLAAVKENPAEKKENPAPSNHAACAKLSEEKNNRQSQQPQAITPP